MSGFSWGAQTLEVECRILKWDTSGEWYWMVGSERKTICSLHLRCFWNSFFSFYRSQTDEGISVEVLKHSPDFGQIEVDHGLEFQKKSLERRVIVELYIQFVPSYRTGEVNPV